MYAVQSDKLSNVAGTNLSSTVVEKEAELLERSKNVCQQVVDESNKFVSPPKETEEGTLEAVIDVESLKRSVDAEIEEMNKTLRGKVSECEIADLCASHKQHIEELFDMFRQKKAQGLWDPLGLNDLTKQISIVAAEAAKVRETVDVHSTEFANIAQNFANLIGHHLPEIVPSLSKAANGIEKVSNDGISFDLGIKNLLDMLLDPKLAIPAAGTLYLFLEVVDHKFDIPNLFYLKFVVGIYGLYSCTKTTLVAQFLQWLTPRPQAAWAEWIEVTVQAVIAGVVGFTVDLSTVNKAVKSLADAVASATKIGPLLESVFEWVKHLIVLCAGCWSDELADIVKNYFGPDTLLTGYLKRAQDLQQLYITDPMKVDVTFANEVTRLVMEVNEYILTIKVSSNNSPVLIAVRQLQNTLLALQRNVADSGMEAGERDDPGLVIIAGAPGAGKTYLTDFISQQTAIDLATEVELPDMIKHWKSKVYPWPIDGKHHDQYCGQPIIVFPDLFCQTDAAGMPSEATNLIYLVGGQPLNLPAAELSKKQRLWFIADVIIANTNALRIFDAMFKSLRNPDALRRRANEHTYYMWVNRKYALTDSADNIQVDPSTNRILGYENDSYLYAKIDKNKLPLDGKLASDIWSFRKLDYTTGGFAEDKVYDLANYIRLTKAYIDDKRHNGALKRAKLEEQARILIEEKIRNIGQPQNGVIEFEVVEHRDITEKLDDAYDTCDDVEERDEDVLQPKTLYCLSCDKPFILNRAFQIRMRDDGWKEPSKCFRCKGKAQMDEEEGEIPADFGVFDATVDNELLFETLYGNFGVNAERFRQPARINMLYQVFGKTFWVVPIITEEVLALIKSTAMLYLDGHFDAIAHSPFNDGSPTLQAKILDGFFPGNIAKGAKVAALVAFVQALERNPLTATIVKHVSAKDLLSMVFEDIADAESKIRLRMFSYAVKDPILAKLTYLTNSIQGWLNSTITVCRSVSDMVINNVLFVGDMVRPFFTFIWNHPRMTLVLDMLCFSAVYAVCMVAVMKIIIWMFPLPKVKGEAQANWSVSIGDRRNITKYLENFYIFYVVRDGRWVRHPCNLVFLGERTGVIVNHTRKAINEFRRLYPDQLIQILLAPFCEGTYEKARPYLLSDVEFFDDAELAKLDLCIVKFKSGRLHANLSKIIPPKECLDWLLSKKNLDGIFVSKMVDDKHNPVGNVVQTPVVMNYSGKVGEYDADLEIEGTPYHLDSLAYKMFSLQGKSQNFVTVSGDCASPCFLIDERKNFCSNMGWKQAQHPWLCYLHTSIQVIVPNGAPVYRELFDKYFAEMTTNIEPMLSSLDKSLDMHMELLPTLGMTTPQYNVLEIEDIRLPVTKNHSSFATNGYKMFVPFKSEIKRSPLFGIDPVTRYPARMGSGMVNGQRVSVLQRAQENYGQNRTVVNQVLSRYAIDCVVAKLISDSGPMSNNDVLELDQCLYGDRAYYLRSINWNSSGGYYLRAIKDLMGTDWKAKTWMIDNKSGKLLPEVYPFVSKLFGILIERVERGERLCDPIIDNIKDELLKIEKIREWNSRLFCTFPFSSILMQRRYFGAFCGYIYKNRFNNGIAIGFNPYSRDVESVVSILHKNSLDCLFLDHRKFDKDQIDQIQEVVEVAATKFYNDYGKPTWVARRVLIEDIIHGIHVCMIDGVLYFYFWENGNSSGNILTAIMNSLVDITDIVLGVVHIKVLLEGNDPLKVTYPPKEDPTDGLAYQVLGDDVVASINQEKLPGVNFNTLSHVMKVYQGLTVTDELKTEGVISDFRTIWEGSFLGRKFVKMYHLGVERVCAVLREYSTVECVQWIKGIYDPEIEVAKIEAMNLELAYGFPDRFYHFVPRYALACKEAYGKYPRYTDYETARSVVLNITSYQYCFDDFETDVCPSDIDFANVLNVCLSNSRIQKTLLFGEGFELIPSQSLGELFLKETNNEPILEMVDAPLKNNVCISKPQTKPLSDSVGVEVSTPLSVEETESKTPANKVFPSKKVGGSDQSGFKPLKADKIEETLECFEELVQVVEETAKFVEALESKKGVGQMDGSEVAKTDFEQGTVVVGQSTTDYIESAPVVMGTTSLTSMPFNLYPEHDADIKSFLARPILLNSGQWTTAQSLNYNLCNGTISTLLASNSMLAHKVEGFNLIKGDFMIKVQLNASPFHQGKLLLHYLPNYSNFVSANPRFGSFKNKMLVQKIQHPHVEIDCRKTSVVMRIPYISPTPWYAVKEVSYDWGTWFLDIFSGLNIGAAAPVGQDYVDFLVYGWFENVELNAPIYPQSNNKEVRRRRGGEEQDENSGPIATALRKTSKVANVLSEIPLLSSVAQPVSWVANILSNAAGVLGWSKPRELRDMSVITDQLMRYHGTCDGPDLSFPGGVSCLNRLEIIDYGSFTSEDEMSLAFLYSIPYYCGEITWSAGAGQGTSLYSNKVGPLSLLNGGGLITGTDTVSTHTTTYELHAPFSYLSRMHMLWRGSMILTMKIVKTQMHSGRLQVTWSPCNTPDSAPGITNSSFSLRTIIDVRTEDTISIELPYLLYTDYAPTVSITPALPYSGQLDIVVLNDLRGPESVAQSVQIQYFFSVGNDFELAVPGQMMSSMAPYCPQMNGKEILVDSVEQGMSFPKTVVGGAPIKTDGLFNAKRCIGEKILSIKSYLLRNSVINSSSSNNLNKATNNMLIDPYFLGTSIMNSSTGAIISSNLLGDHLSLFGPMYSYMRGGLRYTMNANEAGHLPITLYISVVPGHGFFATQPTNISTGVYTNMLTNLSVTSSAGTYPLVTCNIDPSHKGLIYQHVPYYGRLPFTLTTVYNGVDTPTNDPSRPLSMLNWQTEENPSWFTLMRSVSDDFQLMFFTGCPPLATAFT